MPRKDSKLITIDVSEDARIALQEHAKKLGKDLSQYVREVIAADSGIDLGITPRGKYKRRPKPAE